MTIEKITVGIIGILLVGNAVQFMLIKAHASRVLDVIDRIPEKSWFENVNKATIDVIKYIERMTGLTNRIGHVEEHVQKLEDRILTLERGK